jgi:hypothetical protein
VTVDPGVGVYASAGYMQSGYQQMAGEIKIFPDADIGYTPPSFQAFDDGINFPIMSVYEVSEKINTGIGEFNMSAGSPSDPLHSIEATGQAAIIEASFPIAAELAMLSFQWPPVPTVHSGSGGEDITTTGFSPAKDWFIVEQGIYYTAENTPYVMEANPVAWNCYFKPLVNGPFSGSYAPYVSPLVIPKGIDLEAPSSI